MLSPAGVPLELAALRQSRALIRLGLRSSAHSQGFGGSRVGFGFWAGVNWQLAVAIILIAAYARFAWAGGRKRLCNRIQGGEITVWRRSMQNEPTGLGVGSHFDAQFPQGETQARGIRALTLKTSASDFWSATGQKRYAVFIAFYAYQYVDLNKGVRMCQGANREQYRQHHAFEGFVACLVAH